MDDLVALRKEKDDAYDAFMQISIPNIHDQSTEKLVEIDLACRRAARRYEEACRSYSAAIERAL